MTGSVYSRLVFTHPLRFLAEPLNVGLEFCSKDLGRDRN